MFTQNRVSLARASPQKSFVTQGAFRKILVDIGASRKNWRVRQPKMDNSK